jgi:putative hemolysin
VAAVLLLVAANGFFVATEFALVSVRRTRVEQLATQGNAGAHHVLEALQHLDSYIAATQLGITMASLALGWVGEPALSGLIEPPLTRLPFLSDELRSVAAHTISATISFVLITTLHIVLGELAPKSLALQRTEATVLWTARPIHWFHSVFRLPITGLNGIGNMVVRLFGIEPAAGHALVQSAEELKLSVSASREAGLVNPAAQEIVGRALDFSGLQARHLMAPRTEMVAIPRQIDLADLIRVLDTSQHSRYPLYDGTTDNIVGILAAKRLLGPVAEASRRGERALDLSPYISLPLFVPEAMTAYHLLAQMKQERCHLAIVVDEYGLTAGMVTLRNLTDRLAGEVPDEAEPLTQAVTWLPDGTALVDGLALLSDVERALGISLGDTEHDTLGGFIFGQLGRRPRMGDTVEAGGQRMTIEELVGLRISRVRVTPRVLVELAELLA